MSAKILLINPARHFIANHAGLGYLTPLGLVLLGGPLIDAGYQVKLIDHDMNGWDIKKLIHEIKSFSPTVFCLGIRVFVAEILEFIFEVLYSPQASTEKPISRIEL